MQSRLTRVRTCAYSEQWTMFAEHYELAKNILKRPLHIRHGMGTHRVRARLNGGIWSEQDWEGKRGGGERQGEGEGARERHNSIFGDKLTFDCIMHRIHRHNRRHRRRRRCSAQINPLCSFIAHRLVTSSGGGEKFVITFYACQKILRNEKLSSAIFTYILSLLCGTQSGDENKVCMLKSHVRRRYVLYCTKCDRQNSYNMQCVWADAIFMPDRSRRAGAVRNKMHEILLHFLWNNKIWSKIHIGASRRRRLRQRWWRWAATTMMMVITSMRAPSSRKNDTDWNEKLATVALHI